MRSLEGKLKRSIKKESLSRDASKVISTPVDEAMKHPDVLGEGSKKRKKLGKRDKIHAVMGEFKRGALHSGSGPKVRKRPQAVAIALSEARKAKKA